MNKTLRQLMLAISIATAGAAFSGSALAGSADKAIADAKAAQKQAASVQGEWRDIGKMIRKAEKLLQEGKAAQAEKIAREAEAQGMLGYMQATSQAN